MVELDGPAVADVVRRDVVVGDVGGVHAAAERAERGGVEPLTVPLQAWTEDGRHRCRDPARLQVRGGVGLGPGPAQAELLAGGEDRAEHVLALGPRAEQLEARLAGHAVAQRAHPVPGDGEVGHVEELHVGQRGADEAGRRVRRRSAPAARSGKAPADPTGGRPSCRPVRPSRPSRRPPRCTAASWPPSGDPPHRTGPPPGGRAIASPMRWPSALTATYCLALPGPKFANELTPRLAQQPQRVRARAGTGRSCGATGRTARRWSATRSARCASW